MYHLLLGDNVRIPFLENNRGLGLTPLLFPLTITAVFWILRSFIWISQDQKPLWLSWQPWWHQALIPHFCDIRRYLQRSQYLSEASHGNPCCPKPRHNPWGRNKVHFPTGALNLSAQKPNIPQMPIPSTLIILALLSFALHSLEHWWSI